MESHHDSLPTPNLQQPQTPKNTQDFLLGLHSILTGVREYVASKASTC